MNQLENQTENQTDHLTLAATVRAALSRGDPFLFVHVDTACGGEIRYVSYLAAPAWIIAGVNSFLQLAMGGPSGVNGPQVPVTPPVPGDPRI